MSFCAPYLVESGNAKMFARKTGIPRVAVETDYSDGDVGRLKTRVEALLEQLSS